MDATAARMDEAEKKINDIGDKLMENNEAEKETKAKEHDLRINGGKGRRKHISIQT